MPGRAWGPPPDRRPPWWPEGEPWEPGRGWGGRGAWGGSGPWGGRGPWGRRGGGFAFRFGCAFALFFLVAVSAAVLFLWFLATALGLIGGGGTSTGLGDLAAVAGLVVLVVSVVTLVRFGRFIRRTGSVLDELVEATRRVESGDYEVELPEPVGGARPVRALVRGFGTMTARLRADERQRRSLLADVSHELRTPLSVIQGELEAIIDGVRPADEEHLSAILDETRVLSRLVDDLRTLTLSEAGTLPLHREPTDLAVLVAEAAAGHGASAEAAGVQLAVEVEGEIPLLDVDPVRIREVLGNLLANALRYTPAGGRVTVTARRDGGSVVVAVADTGAGIDPAVLPKVFERFVKSADSRGSGLGLAIARNLVVAHGGEIEAASSVGEGSTITFRLPVPQTEDRDTD
jgi:two-component system sensor histidine kinase BaeS